MVVILKQKHIKFDILIQFSTIEILRLQNKSVFYIYTF